MQPILNIALNAARQAGEIIVRDFENVDRLVRTPKSHHEYFCEVDIKAEQAIIQTIRKAYPEHGILAEESGAYQTDADTVWIIDPLDGTSNYLHGFPFFSVSIAVKVKGRIEHGLIFDPLRHEFFMASRGRGARMNDRRIRVSKQTQLSEALLGTGFTFRNPQSGSRYFPTFEAMYGQCAGIRRSGSAALDLAYVASGRLDGFWEFGLKPWDIAAGVLLIQESGGMISDLQGGEDYLISGDIIAATPKVFKSLLQIIVPAATKRPA
jgi:myo-inositol-1(or 4)-monophosphatase